MAYDFANTPRDVWESAYSDYILARESFANSRTETLMSNKDHIAWDRAGNTLLKLHAPDIDGVIAKLDFLFSDELFDESPYAAAKRAVIGDLRRINFQIRTGEVLPEQEFDEEQD